MDPNDKPDSFSGVAFVPIRLEQQLFPVTFKNGYRHLVVVVARSAFETHYPNFLVRNASFEIVRGLPATTAYQ